MKIVTIEENMNSIISLIENAEKFLVIVSPFNDFAGWDNLRKAIDSASERGVPVNYYVREGEGFNGIEGLNVKLFEVSLLHAKMFFSEKEALISSGNLTSRPDINWVCKLDKQEEYNDLIKFFEQYIKQSAQPFKR
jgi:sugar-specific transcriptional regulator TrmB